MLVACAPEVQEAPLPAGHRSALLRTAITVSDIEASMHFYSYVLGFQPGFEGDITSPWVADLLQLEPEQTVRFAVLTGADDLAGGAGAMIGLLQVHNPAPASLQRPEGASLVAGEAMLATVTADIDTVRQRLEEVGATILFGPAESPNGVETELVFRDPDGLRVHVVQRRR